MDKICQKFSIKFTVIILCLLMAPFLYATNRTTNVVNAINKIENSVVNIRTEKIIKDSYNPFFNDPFFKNFFDFNKTYKTQSLGSGFFINKNGLIVTNYHVIEAANRIFVIDNNNHQYEAEYIGGNSIIDIAIIKIKSKNEFPEAILGTSKDIMLGETIIAIGNPYGLNSSVTTGVVSAKNRIIKSNNGLVAFIQTDALINPGNSGGPLINIDGEVIGINSAIYKDAQGIGFSTPIDLLKRVLPEILKYKKIRKGYLGFITKSDNQIETGMTIKYVDNGSHAASLGIKKGDVLLSINNMPVDNLKSLEYQLYIYPPGNKIMVSLKRGKNIYNGSLIVGVMPENFGLKLLDIFYGIKIEEQKGFFIVIKSKIPDYIKNGDKIIAVNNKEINSLKEFNNYLIDDYTGSSTLTIYRNNGIINIKIGL